MDTANLTTFEKVFLAIILLVMTTITSFSMTLIPVINYGSLANIVFIGYNRTAEEFVPQLLPESHELHKWKLYEMISSIVGSLIVGYIPRSRYLRASGIALASATLLRIATVYVPEINQVRITAVGLGLMKSVIETVILFWTLRITKSHMAMICLMKSFAVLGDSFSALNFRPRNGFNQWSDNVRVIMTSLCVMAFMLNYILSKVLQSERLIHDSDNPRNYASLRFPVFCVSCAVFAIASLLESNHAFYYGALHTKNLFSFHYPPGTFVSCDYEYKGLIRLMVALVLSVAALKIRSSILLLVSMTCIIIGTYTMYQSAEITCNDSKMRNSVLLSVSGIVGFIPSMMSWSFYRLIWTSRDLMWIIISRKLGESVSLVFFFLYFRYGSFQANYVKYKWESLSEGLFSAGTFKTFVFVSAIVCLTFICASLIIVAVIEWKQSISIEEGTYTAHISRILRRKGTNNRRVVAESVTLEEWTCSSNDPGLNSDVLDIDKDVVQASSSKTIKLAFSTTG
jgi:hypothetical protein